MHRTTFAAIVTLSLAIFSSNLCAGKNEYQSLAETTGGEQRATAPFMVSYLRTNIPNVKISEPINIEMFETILTMHNKLVTSDEFAKNWKSRRLKEFTHEAQITCELPDFCDVAPRKSFGYRCMASCTEDCGCTDSDICCGTVFSYVPCLFVQVLCGWFLPCGYSSGCCCKYAPEPINQQEIKHFLDTIETLYSDSYWDTVIEKHDGASDT